MTKNIKNLNEIIKENNSIINKIAFVGNYLPRQCGIATFTTDLCEAISTQYEEIQCIVLPVNDTAEGYKYPPRVRFELIEKDINSYRSAADFLNIHNVDLVSLQFEHGIFGGKAGSYILALLRGLRMPIVTTMHTILKEPDVNQRKVVEQLADLSDRMVVMSSRGAKYLKEIYHVPPEKIEMIHHGIPDVPFVDPSFNKDTFGVEGKTVILSFGLLSSNKGIENVIQAMPEILKHFPDCVYIVVGATHPNVLKNEGETYRQSLQWLAQKIGVASNVIFYNSFVKIEELIEFISIADIYITPYLNEAQIVSGTLAYTLGAGKAIISTPIWYAEEVLAEGRGIIVPFKDPGALAEKVINLLENEIERSAIRKRAYIYGRKMIWSEVAKQYRDCFMKARIEKHRNIPAGLISKTLDKFPGMLPPLKLDHLIQMTDYTGVFQHALFSVPDYYHGYTTDDNARALLVSILLNEAGNEKISKLTSRYLSFLGYAFNKETGRFRNCMDYQHNWLDDSGSDDCNGRAIMALGIVINHTNNRTFNSLSGQLFEQALPSLLNTTSPRAWSFALLGLNEYLQKFSGDSIANRVRDELAGRLLGLYQTNKTEDWQWFENELSYCNAVLPHALLVSGKAVDNRIMIDASLESLKWLAIVQGAGKGHFVPIGSNGFYKKNGERARFDQQPIEAQTMVSASLEAYKVTGDSFWNNESKRSFEWFLGLNDLNLSLYDPTSGGCKDGLHSDRLNENQGSESTLAFLQSLLEIRLAEHNNISLESIIK